MSRLFDLSGKVIMVTGASSGLGEHFAQTLAAAGASVVITARRVDRLESLADKISAAGGKAIPLAMDVTSLESIQNAFQQAENELGTIDVLVNNAGVADPMSVLDISEDNWDFMMDTNLKGAFLVAQTASQQMVASKKPGSIINISSILGLRVGTSQSHYAIAKAGVVQMTKAMALELARASIRVNAIAPGYFKTEMNGEFFETDRGKEYLKKIPMRRLGELEELDGPLLLLASEASAFMTGSVLEVDGGHLVNAL